MGTTKIEKLKGASNWDLWRIRIRALLAEKGLIDAIKPKKEFQKNTPKETIEEYKEKRLSDSIKAAAIIRLNLGLSPLIQTKKVEEDDAEALYNRLKELYEPKGFFSEFLLAKKLFSTILETVHGFIESYLTKIRAYTDELALREKAIPTEIIAAYTLNNLNARYEHLVAALTQNFRKEKEIDLDVLFNAIIDESNRLKDKESIEGEIAMTTNNGIHRKSTKKRDIKYYKYGRTGYIARNYKKVSSDGESDKSDDDTKETSLFVL